MSDLAFNREARVVVVDHDRYGRVAGRVHVGNTNVNAELIRQGAAWVYRDFARDRALFVLEDEARAAKRGLWALPEAQRTPPWEWRNGQPGGHVAALLNRACGIELRGQAHLQADG